MKLDVLQRTCGECTACCTALAITELNKPSNTPCHYLKGNGCSIHGNHPTSCKQFECYWKLGFLPEKFRPDKSGMLIWGGMNQRNEVFLLREVEMDSVKYLLSKLPEKRRNRPFIVVPHTVVAMPRPAEK